MRVIVNTKTDLWCALRTDETTFCEVSMSNFGRQMAEGYPTCPTCVANMPPQVPADLLYALERIAVALEAMVEILDLAPPLQDRLHRRD